MPDIVGLDVSYGVPTEENSFRLLSGTPKDYVKVGDSGNKREQTFCPTRNASAVSLCVGTIRQLP